MILISKLFKAVAGLYLLPLLSCLATTMAAQTIDQKVLFDVEIDKTVYYQDEALLLLMRIENLSEETLKVVPMMGRNNATEHDHYPRVRSLTSGLMYPIQQHPWSNYWKLKPGEITYITQTFALEYRDPEVILAPLPAGEYMLELEIHVTDSSNGSYFLKQRRDFFVKAIADTLPPKTFGQSETMKQYYEKRRMKLDTAVWNAEINRLLDSSEATPYRNTLIKFHFNVSEDLNGGPQGTINGIQKGIDVALKRPNDILPIVLLRYGRRDKKYNYLYCERFHEIAATGDTRLHRYFREYICK